MLLSATTNMSAAESRQPSLRRRLLTFVLLPTLLLMVIATIAVYVLALSYANRVHDRDLVWSSLGLADAIEDGHSEGRLSEDVLALLQFTPGVRTFYSVRSIRHGLREGGSAELAPPVDLIAGQAPILFDARISGLPVRGAAVSIWSPTEKGDRLVISLAETLDNRQIVAREILGLTLVVEIILMIALFLLMWRGVSFGLRILETPIARLAGAERTLAPLSDASIPVEIQPLTREIDHLFERVQALLALQERFVADAAHQLRTPLAGLSLQVERARTAASEFERQAALSHVQALTMRLSRAANQLLNLARAQAPQPDAASLVPIVLAHELPVLVSAWVREALAIGIDLGYEGEDGSAALVLVQPGALQDVVDNLIDNALHHAPHGGAVTVALSEEPGYVVVSVDDSGRGVPDEMLPRLGERFFRAPGAIEGGTGLGLAIVRRTAERQGFQVLFGRSKLGGLRVELRFVRVGERG